MFQPNHSKLQNAYCKEKEQLVIHKVASKKIHCHELKKSVLSTLGIIDTPNKFADFSTPVLKTWDPGHKWNRSHFAQRIHNFFPSRLDDWRALLGSRNIRWHQRWEEGTLTCSWAVLLTQQRIICKAESEWVCHTRNYVLPIRPATYHHDNTRSVL